MKTKDLINYTPPGVRPHRRQSVGADRRPGRREEGPNIKMALMGLVCAAGVLGVLALLYQFA